MFDGKTGFRSELLIITYVLYIGFVGMPGSFILMKYQFGGAVMLALALLLAGVPLIIKLIFEKNRYMVAFMVTVVAVYLGIAYVNRVDVPEAEPERASSYATAWLGKLSSNPDEAFTVFIGSVHDKSWMVKRIKQVDLTKIDVDLVQKYAPEAKEGRGDCNIYDVMFIHSTGSARVGIRQCYDGGPEFEVSRADFKFDNEGTPNRED